MIISEKRGLKLARYEVVTRPNFHKMGFGQLNLGLGICVYKGETETILAEAENGYKTF